MRHGIWRQGDVAIKENRWESTQGKGSGHSAPRIVIGANKGAHDTKTGEKEGHNMQLCNMTAMENQHQTPELSK